MKTAGAPSGLQVATLARRVIQLGLAACLAALDLAAPEHSGEGARGIRGCDAASPSFND